MLDVWGVRGQESWIRYASLLPQQAESEGYAEGSSMGSAMMLKAKSTAARCVIVVTQRLHSLRRVTELRVAPPRDLAILTLNCFGLLFTALTQHADFLLPTSAPQERNNSDRGVPAYHPDLPPAELPPVLDPQQFDKQLVQTAYRFAVDLKKILYQQPCYCYCDRKHGHNSLLDCFTTKHTAGCGTCLKELFYIYEQTNQGATAVQIREGIIRGDWKAVNLDKYRNPPDSQFILVPPM